MPKPVRSKELATARGGAVRGRYRVVKTRIRIISHTFRTCLHRNGSGTPRGGVLCGVGDGAPFLLLSFRIPTGFRLFLPLPRLLCIAVQVGRRTVIGLRRLPWLQGRRRSGKAFSKIRITIDGKSGFCTHRFSPFETFCCLHTSLLEVHVLRLSTSGQIGVHVLRHSEDGDRFLHGQPPCAIAMSDGDTGPLGGFIFLEARQISLRLVDVR